MIKNLAPIGACALAVGCFAGVAHAQASYSPPMKEPGVRYVLPQAALAERNELPSGLVYEGRSVRVGTPPAISGKPEGTGFAGSLPESLKGN